MRALPPYPAESCVPRYFFDTHDGQHVIDDEGIEFVDIDAACAQAMRYLPEVGRWEIPKDGDKQAFTVLVRDETNTVVYTATLTFAGVRLDGVVKKAIA